MARAALNKTGFLCKENGAHAAERETSSYSEEIRQKRFAMRTVEFNQAMSGGKELSCRPSPRAPQPGSHCNAATFSSEQHQKGDTSNELRMGTFLMSFDIAARQS